MIGSTKIILGLVCALSLCAIAAAQSLGLPVLARVGRLGTLTYEETAV